MMDKSIESKELYAVVMACETWGSRWSGRKLLLHCDNQAIVSIWQTGRTRNKDLMLLVRALFFTAAKNHYNILIRHIPGASNSIADALSRMQLTRFRSLAPQADPHPSPTPVRPTFLSPPD